MPLELPSIHEWLYLLGEFFQTGGWVLYPILAVTALIFMLILERLLFRFVDYPRLKKRLLSAMQSQPVEAQRLSIFCDLDLALKSQLPMIKTLVVICPLIGLLGTVTGMIQVFDSLALFGTGNPRLMAAGVASATFPTMTGMAVALVGMLFYSRLRRWSESERNQLLLVLKGGAGAQ